MIEKIVELVNNFYSDYGIAMMIVFIAAYVLFLLKTGSDLMKPGKKNQKAVWTCPSCGVSGTLYFREYGPGSGFSIGADHTENSPFCDGEGFSVSFSDMTTAEIQQQNKSARERIER